MTTTITVDTVAFRDALKKSVCDNTAAIPIYRHALITGVNDEINLTTTDEMMTYRISIPARIDGDPPNFTGNVNLMTSATIGLDGETRLEYADGILRLHNGMRRFKIDSLPGDQFPICEIYDSIDITLTPNELRTAINRVAYCALHNETRSYLNGVWFCPGDVVAMNGIAMACMPVNTGIPADQNVIIPGAAVRKGFPNYIADDSRARLLVGQTGKALAIEITTASQVLRTQLIGDRYPDGWRKAARKPDAFVHHITIPANDLRASLSRIMPFAQQIHDGFGTSKRTSGCYVKFSLIGGQLRMQSRDNDDAIEFIPVDSDAEIQVAIDATLLKRVIDLADQIVVWHHDNAETIQCFTLPDRDDRHYIMPMRM